jgi:DNA-binding CsgD family transcriptional regulator
MTSAGLRELLEGDALNDTQIEILYGAARGETAPQTAQRLFLSPETLKDYRKKVIAKLGAKNIVNAVVRAIGTGVIDISRIMDEEET